MNPDGNNAVVPVIRPDFIDVRNALLKLVALFTVVPNRLAFVKSQLLNAQFDRLVPERSTDVMYIL